MNRPSVRFRARWLGTTRMWLGGLALASGVLSPRAAFAQQDSLGRDFTTMDLEDLARIRITTVSRKPESISQATAAITVISREDIRRYGAATLPEALRLVPGLQVARAGTREFAVSARGFNDVTTNKMLVLIDGRAVYSPLFAGVVWAVQRVNLRDVDRIEVIRGPGATLWGSNAVNGVINIITRPAAETQGGELLVSAGTAERYGVNARVGTSVRPGFAVRFYGNGFHESVTETPGGDDIKDGWGIVQGGFRADWSGSRTHSFTLQGDAYHSSGRQLDHVASINPPFVTPVTGDNTANGFNLLGRYTRTFSSRSDFVIQTYFDRATNNKPGLYGDVGVSIGDVDMQYHFPLGARHDVIAGMGYRIIHDDIEGAFPVEFSPVSRTISLVTGFLQDDIVLLPGHLALTVGSKFEHNHFSGLEVQPNLRVLWTPTFSSTVWGAVSRAVRSPSRVDEDVISRFVFDNAGTTTIIQGRGTHHFKSEELVAYEMGYRATPHQRLSIDLAAFYNDYDRLRTLRASTPETQGSNVIIPFLVENEAKGQTYGGDAAITFQVSAWWRLRFGYSYLRMEVQKRKKAPPGTNIDAVPGFNPEHQGSIWSSFDLPGQIELDVAARYVSPLPGGTQDVPHYITGDAKLGFHLGSHVRFSVVGRDLFQARHFEFRLPALIVPEERDIERRVTAALAWAF